MLRFLFFLVSLSLFSYTCDAQLIKFPYDENFEWQVKQIDEFMDRFNNEDFTPIRQYLKEKHDMPEVARIDLLKSLFNTRGQHWDQMKVWQFLTDVTQSPEDPLLDFYDKDWYARLNCKGQFKGQPVDFYLVLSLWVNPKTGASKWIINSVEGDFLQTRDTDNLRFEVREPQRGGRSLNPASFGTDFMALVDALADTANYHNYLMREKVSDSLLIFFDMLYNKTLRFRQVNHITYHFLQIPGWIFKVEDFPRQDTNSGWLISDLILAETEQKKNIYRRQILNLEN